MRIALKELRSLVRTEVRKKHLRENTHKISLKELRSLVKNEVRKTLRENVGRGPWEPEFYEMGLDREGLEQAKEVWARIQGSYYEELKDLVDYKWFGAGQVRTLDIEKGGRGVYDTVYEELADQIKDALKSVD
jgi:hypothetical protein